MRRPIAIAAATLFVVGCSGPAASPSQSQAAESSAPSAVSVICGFFAAGGPNDDLKTAAIAAFTPGAGADEAPATRAAISKIVELARLTSGEEQSDLLTLAGVLDAAAMSGEGFVGWSDAHNAFLVKYADQCGYQLAE